MLFPNQTRNCGIAVKQVILALALLFMGSIALRAQTGGQLETIGGAFVGYVDGDNNVSQFNSPRGVALDGRGNLLIADYGNNAVRSMRLSDATVSTLFFANSPVAVAATTNFIYVLNQGGGFIAAYDRFGNQRENLLNGLFSPTALTVDTNGNVYVAEGGGVVRRINPAGSVTGFYRVTDGIPDLRGVAVYPDGKVAVSDANAKVIWIFDGPNMQPRVLAGTRFAEGFADGAPGVGMFRYPGHIALGPNNSIVVADRYNHRVRVVSCDGVLTTLYGVDPTRWEQPPGPNSFVFPGWLDGSVDFAESRDPVGVAVDASGNVFGTEVYYHLVRAGTGLSFPAGCGGPGQTNGGSTNLVVATPVLNPNSGWFPEGVTISISASNSSGLFGPDVRLHYTLDGTEPTTNSPAINMVDGVGRLALPGPIDLAGLKVRAFIGASSSPVVSARPTEVPVPVLSPNSGYYPMGVRIVVTSTNGFPNGTQLFYTINGTEPTTNSFFVPIVGNQAVIDLRGGPFDLRSLRVRGFRGPNAGQTTSGQAVTFTDPRVVGEVGIPPDIDSGNLSAGVGSIIVVPVVANLRTGQSLRSLQFVAEFVSLGQAPPPGGVNQLRVQVMSTNDFIQVAAATFEAPTQTIPSLFGSTNRLAVAYIGSDSGFAVTNFAVVAMLAVPISPEAREGDRYRLGITQVSGTSDGVDQSVGLRALPPREIVVQNVPWLVGDSSPAYWYNAGDFGNGLLDNADVNNAFYASLGFRVPFEYTDVFNAMDAFPPPNDANPSGGDFEIRFQDYQTILNRSLGFDRNNWFRRHEGSDFIAIPAQLQGASLHPAEVLNADSFSSTASTATGTWKKHAAMKAGVLQNIPQTSPVSVPVYVEAYPGTRISGMQFVARVRTPSGSAPLSSVRFVAGTGIPRPHLSGSTVPGLGTLNDAVYCSWNLDTFNPPLEGVVQIGTLEFQVPSNAQSLQAYEITFSRADGAPRSDTAMQYDFESFRGAVWINSLALTAQDTVSDEWKSTFFGNADSAEGKAGMDPDGDGFTNLQEFRSNLNPTTKDWRTTWLRGRFAFRFLREAGKKYQVQRSSDLVQWTDATTNIYSGTTGLQDFTEPVSTGRVNNFYRVIEVP